MENLRVQHGSMISLHSRLLLGNSSSFPHFVVCSFCLLINCVFVCDVRAIVDTLLCELGAGWFWISPLLLWATLLRVWSVHSPFTKNKTKMDAWKAATFLWNYFGAFLSESFAAIQIKKHQQTCVFISDIKMFIIFYLYVVAETYIRTSVVSSWL